MKPSRNNFRAFVQEVSMMPPPAPARPAQYHIENSDRNRRTKVEDNLEIDNDLLKISQRRNVDEADNI